MTTAMASPPPKTSTAADEDSISESAKAAPMDPPPPRNPKPSKPDAGPSENRLVEPKLNPTLSDTSTLVPSQLSNSTDGSNGVESSDDGEKQEQRNKNAAVPYTIPPWSGPPDHRFFIEVLKDGAIVDQHDVNKKGAYMFGRVDLCDFVLEHPTISRFHAVLQFKSNGGAYLYDLGSTHGTSINKSQVKKRDYVDLHVGDVIRFGLSSRLYIFQGPPDLMPPEADLKSLRTSKIRQERQDMEASLLRAKVEASRADGISWGMQEDAIEENEDDVDEITWQTYKGQLTEKQEKTREKVIKRLEKIAHMKKEIDAIRVKDISQGGLTQGQQTQIARNEQRISQIMEELENLEETLNESIRESIGARAGKLSRGKKKVSMEDDEDDYLSDDDEFYDRTKKSSKHKASENQSVETADSLLDKKDVLMKQLQDKEKLLHEDDISAETNVMAEASDALDAYMSDVSSQLVLDRKEKLLKEMSALQSELDRILYLLRIADPTGEAAKKRESKAQNPKTIVTKKPSLGIGSRPSPQNNLEISPSSSKIKILAPEALPAKSNADKTNVNSKSEPDVKKEDPESKNDEHKPTVYTVAKPQWLGAVEDRQKQESIQEVSVGAQDTVDQFVDYKDREKIVNKTESLSSDPGIEDAPSGLIIRKRKQVEKSKASEEVKDPEETNNSNGAGLKAEDAVALLLKHSRGYHASKEEDGSIDGDVMVEKEGKKDGKKARKSGPEKPSTWVPPEGQSGDGRTSLNDRLGY